MSLHEVFVTEDVYFVMLTHALTTEKEEVMGLLLGDTETKAGRMTARVTGLLVLTRSDKRKDRVEISPEQLSAASIEADKITDQLKKTTRVIGWYHSHPHITVFPSHVDVRTQSSYQMLDKGFIGLIISCFNKDPTDVSGRIQITAFQSIDTSSAMMDENDGKTEVPLKIIPSPSVGPNTLGKLYQLQSILYNEEKASFTDSIQSNQSSSNTLQDIHSISVYHKALCRLLELEVLPSLYAMEQRHKSNTEKIQELLERKRNLEMQIKNKKAKNL